MAALAGMQARASVTAESEIRDFIALEFTQRLWAMTFKDIYRRNPALLARSKASVSWPRRLRSFRTAPTIPTPLLSTTGHEFPRSGKSTPTHSSGPGPDGASRCSISTTRSTLGRRELGSYCRTRPSRATETFRLSRRKRFQVFPAKYKWTTRDFRVMCNPSFLERAPPSSSGCRASRPDDEPPCIT